MVDFHDAKPAVVARMLLWLYTGKYPAAKLVETSSQFANLDEPHIEDFNACSCWSQDLLREQILHLLRHAAAKKLGFPSMQEEAFRGFCRSLKGVDGIVDNFEAASVHTQILVKTVYTETSDHDRDIRDIVLKQLQYELHDRQLELYY